MFNLTPSKHLPSTVYINREDTTGNMVYIDGFNECRELIQKLISLSFDLKAMDDAKALIITQDEVNKIKDGEEPKCS